MQVEGPSLEQLLQEGSLSPEEEAGVLGAVGKTAAVVHDWGLVHGALYARNIMLPGFKPGSGMDPKLVRGHNGCVWCLAKDLLCGCVVSCTVTHCPPGIRHRVTSPAVIHLQQPCLASNPLGVTHPLCSAVPHLCVWVCFAVCMQTLIGFGGAHQSTGPEDKASDLVCLESDLDKVPALGGADGSKGDVCSESEQQGKTLGGQEGAQAHGEAGEQTGAQGKPQQAAEAKADAEGSNKRKAGSEIVQHGRQVSWVL